MALFNGREKKETVEKKLVKILDQNPIVEEVIAQIKMNENESWLRMGQDFYDKGKRIVKVNTVEIAVEEAESLKAAQEIRALDFIFTVFEYAPLHSYSSDGIIIPESRVCYLLADVLRNKMMAELPEFQYSGEIYTIGDKTNEIAYFYYEVPRKIYKDWFEAWQAAEK